MIIHGLVFLICASLGTELRAGAINENCHDEQIVFPTGSTVHGVNGKPVELNKAQDAWRISNGEIIFKLYTKQRPTRAQELKINDTESLSTSGFNSSKPTYIIIDGGTSNENGSSAHIRDAYVAHTNSNVIVIEWRMPDCLAHSINVSYKAIEVSETVQQFIEWLYANKLNADYLTLVGHSLGANIMGIVGSKLDPKVNNIVGLDPAMPIFNSAGDSFALSRNDAKHVQIIHTNAGGFGYQDSYGHSDFYPNGGKIQPNCSDVHLGMSQCSHERSIYLFAESISMSFVGTACSSYEDFKSDNCGKKPQTATMGGLDLGHAKPGTYYLRTGSAPPFSIVMPVNHPRRLQLLQPDGLLRLYADRLLISIRQKFAK